MERETWMPIEGYEDIYKIADSGKIKSLRTGRLMKTSHDSNKYARVVLTKDGGQKHRKMHRLVAQHFLPNPNKFSWVKMKNGKEDCSVGNLKWAESPKDRVMPRDKLIAYYKSCDQSKWRRDQHDLLAYLITDDSRHLNRIYEKIYNSCLGFIIDKVRKIGKDEELAIDLFHDSYEGFTKSVKCGRFRIDRAYVKHSIEIYTKRLVRNLFTNWLRENYGKDEREIY